MDITDPALINRAHDTGGLISNDRAFPDEKGSHVRAYRSWHGSSELFSAPELVHHVRPGSVHLGGNACPLRQYAPDRVLLHERDLHPGLRCPYGSNISTRSASNNGMFSASHFFPSKMRFVYKNYASFLKGFFRKS